jgi:hypothetical protein
VLRHRQRLSQRFGDNYNESLLEVVYGPVPFQHFPRLGECKPAIITGAASSSFGHPKFVAELVSLRR